MSVADLGPMTASPAGALEDRIAQLEREVAELRRRIVLLERMIGTVGEHPVDREVTTSKVTYDWQA